MNMNMMNKNITPKARYSRRLLDIIFSFCYYLAIYRVSFAKQS